MSDAKPINTIETKDAGWNSDEDSFILTNEFQPEDNLVKGTFDRRRATFITVISTVTLLIVITAILFAINHDTSELSPSQVTQFSAPYAYVSIHANPEANLEEVVPQQKEVYLPESGRVFDELLDTENAAKTAASISTSNYVLPIRATIEPDHHLEKIKELTERLERLERSTRTLHDPLTLSEQAEKWYRGSISSANKIISDVFLTSGIREKELGYTEFRLKSDDLLKIVFIATAIAVSFSALIFLWRKRTPKDLIATLKVKKEIYIPTPSYAGEEGYSSSDGNEDHPKFAERPIFPDRDIRKEILMSFKKHLGKGERNKIQEVGITFQAACMNVAIFGGTGSGKTVGVCYPLLDRLVSAYCPGLVLDVKGDYARLIRHLAPDRYLIIGPTDDAESFNLIGGLSPAAVRKIIDAALPATRDRRWQHIGGVYVELVCHAVRARESRDATLLDIYELIGKPDKFLDYWEATLAMNLPKRIRETLKGLSSHAEANTFSIFGIGKLQRESTEEGIYQGGREYEQYQWQTESLLAAIAPIAGDYALRKRLCGNKASRFADLIYKQRRIIVMDMTADEYPETAYFVSRLLRTKLKLAIMQASDEDRKGFGEAVFSFMLIDEYQEHMLDSDSHWFDRSRSFGHINIVSTQSLNSMYAKADHPEAAKTIIQNCRTQIILPTFDFETKRHAENLLGRDVSEILVRNKRPGACVVYAPDRMIFSANECTTGLSMYAFMKRYIEDNFVSKLPRCVTIDDPNEFVETSGGNKEICRSDIESGFMLHVITSSSIQHDGIQDFLHVLNKSISKDIYTTYGSDTLANSNAIKEIAQNIQKEMSSIGVKKHHVIAIVRGGGDVSNGTFDVYDADYSVSAIASAKRHHEFTFVSGVGHANNRFLIDDVCDYSEITPSMAAVRINRLFEQEQQKTSLESECITTDKFSDE
jgi:hypothetical protein